MTKHSFHKRDTIFNLFANISFFLGGGEGGLRSMERVLFFPVVGFEPGSTGPLNHMQGLDPKTVLSVHTNTLLCANLYWFSC